MHCLQIKKDPIRQGSKPLMWQASIAGAKPLRWQQQGCFWEGQNCKLNLAAAYGRNWCCTMKAVVNLSVTATGSKQQEANAYFLPPASPALVPLITQPNREPAGEAEIWSVQSLPQHHTAECKRSGKSWEITVE